MDAPGTYKDNIVSQWQRATAPSQPSDRSVLRRPRRVRDRHKMVVYLLAAGWKPKEVAQHMGYTPSRVSIIGNSTHPEIVKVWEEARARVADVSTDLLLRFRMEANKSLDTLIQVRDQTEEVGQRRLAARDILDRAGYSVVRKQLNLNADIPAAQLEAVVNKIHEANEVEIQSDAWVVKNPNLDKKVG